LEDFQNLGEVAPKISEYNPGEEKTCSKWLRGSMPLAADKGMLSCRYLQKLEESSIKIET